MSDLEGVSMEDLEVRTAAAQMEWERHRRLELVAAGEAEQLAGMITGLVDVPAELEAPLREAAARARALAHTLREDWIQAPVAAPNGAARVTITDLRGAVLERGQ